MSKSDVALCLPVQSGTCDDTSASVGVRRLPISHRARMLSVDGSEANQCLAYQAIGLLPRSATSGLGVSSGKGVSMPTAMESAGAAGHTGLRTSRLSDRFHLGTRSTTCVGFRSVSNRLTWKLFRSASISGACQSESAVRKDICSKATTCTTSRHGQLHGSVEPVRTPHARVRVLESGSD